MDPDQTREILTRARRYFAAGRTRPVKARLDALDTLYRVLIEREADILGAVARDLAKPPFEAYTAEVGIVREEIKFVRRRLRRWARPSRVPAPMVHFPSKARIHHEPYGVALILSPWNYPFMLALAPLVGAIAAGNCAVVKPSEFAPATASILADIIAQAFPEDFVRVVQGDAEVSARLVAMPFDYIFYTGSTATGRKVMAAAAANLVPVTLELGGKSPCIVTPTAKLATAAKRIVWGKFMNAGQTCVSPDYVLVHRSIRDDFLSRAVAAVEELYGANPATSPDLARIVNERHFDRLQGLLEGSGTVVTGQAPDRTTRYFPPTILSDVPWDAPVMEEEIFGPIMPVLAYDDFDDAMSAISARPKPLAAYLFAEDRAARDRFVHELSFGGGCVNDTVVHLSTPRLPFGGVGASGHGSYRGKAGFDTFSHHKSVLEHSTGIDFAFKYPPFRDKLAFVRRFLG